MILAGTGSRSLEIASFEHKKFVLNYCIAAITEMQPDVIMSGMAEGFDHCLAVAAMHCDKPLFAAVPNETYGNYYWRDHSVTGRNQATKFVELLTYAANTRENGGGVAYVTGKKLYVDGLHANFVRNKFMVDRADHFLVYNPLSKGTAHCYDLIQKAGKDFTLVPYEVQAGDYNND